MAVFLEVEVDTWTGAVRTVNAAMGSDCGTVVNPAMARGQLEGGLSKGAGYALVEGCFWDKDGQLTSRGFPIDGKTPAIERARSSRTSQTYFAETYEPTGPFGAKGIGEAAMNPVAAAYANAIANAIGIRFTGLPMTPEKIVAALDQGGRQAMSQTNSHILSHRFAYLRPTSLKEAVAMLREHPEAKVLAGGTNVLVDMKMQAQPEQAQPERAKPAEALPASAQPAAALPAGVMDITHVRELVGIVEDPAGIRIGAATPIRALATSPILWRDYTALAEAAAAFGSTQIAMRGTIGGNVCNGSPASDTVPALLAFGAEAILASAQGERVVPVGDLLVGPGKVRLRDGELLVAVRLPKSVGNAGSAFLKISRVRADLAKVNVAVRLTRDEAGRCATARIELGSVGPTVLRARKAELLLSKEAITDATGAGRCRGSCRRHPADRRCEVDGGVPKEGCCRVGA